MKRGSHTSGSAEKKRSPWLLLLAAVALVLIFDAAVFHSRLYTRVLKPDSYAGRFQLLVTREIERGDSPFQEVLLLGDSRCVEGFSEKLALELLEPTQLRLYSGAFGGSTPRLWYYLMRELLARGKGYSAVVVTLDTFMDIDSGGDPANRRLDLRVLAPALGVFDVVGFATSYSNWREALSVTCSLILKGHAFKEDVLDFLTSPSERLAAVKLHRQNFARWRFNYPGREGQLSGLEYDPESRDFLFTEDLSQAQKTQARRQLLRVFATQNGQQYRYRQLWLTRLVDLLQEHSIRVVFARLPRHPAFPQPAFPQPETHLRAPSTVSQLKLGSSVEVLPEIAFAHLDRQELFFDSLHLNREGRERFTRSLVQELAPRLREGKLAAASAPGQPGAGLE